MALKIDFAFEGFRLIRQKPLVVVFWGIVLLIGNALGVGTFFYLAWPSIQTLISGGMPRSNDPTAVLALFQGFAGPYLILLIMMLVVQAIIACAVYRMVLGHPNGSFGFIRFGSDELRMMAVMIVLGIVLFFVNIALSLVGGIFTLIFSAILGQEAGALIGNVLTLVAYFYVVIRLSLAYVQSFDEKKFNLFGSWNLTGKNFGTLLLGYILMAVLGIVVMFLCVVIFAVIVAISLGSNVEALNSLNNNANPAEVMRVLTTLAPLMIGYLVFLSLIVMPLITAIFTGGPAAAYMQLAGTGKAKVENVF